ncbi:hypothetical protein ACQSSU_11160 [Micromonospora echinospora]
MVGRPVARRTTQLRAGDSLQFRQLSARRPDHDLPGVVPYLYSGSRPAGGERNRTVTTLTVPTNQVGIPHRADM